MFNHEWYQLLNKPPLTPASEVFLPAWILLYITILASLILYIRAKSRRDKTKGYVFFILQMIFNIIWSPVFFMLQNIHAGLFVIIFLDIAVILNIKEFYKISKNAAYLLIPYLAWIIFATYLNFGLYLLN